MCGYILAWTTKRFPLPEVFPVCSFHQILTKLDLQNMSRYCWTCLDIVSVLWQEEGYMVKYSRSTREMQRAEPERFSEGSGYISPYILSCVTIQTFSISKSYTSSMSFLVGQYWKSWFSILIWQLGYIFPYYPVDDAIRVHIDLVENSVFTSEAISLVTLK